MDTRLDVASRLLAGLAAHPNSTLDNIDIAWIVKRADRLIAQVRDTAPAAADEIDTMRRALVEAGRCVECSGHGRVCGSVACIECGGDGIRTDLTPETQAAVKAAREATNG